MPIRKRMKQIKADADTSLRRMDSLSVEIERSLDVIGTRLSKVRGGKAPTGSAAQGARKVLQ